MTKFKEIYFVRHGETEWNRLHKQQGCEADIPLNESGKLQSEITGEYLKNFRMKDKPFDCIISSPLLRTKETAEILKEKIGFEGDIIYDKLIIEAKRGPSTVINLLLDI